MKGHALVTCLLGLGILLVAAGVATARNSPAAAIETGAPSGLLFIENVGQFDEGARFQLRGGRGTVWLADDAIWITLLEPAATPDDPLTRLDVLRARTGEGPAPFSRTGVNLRISFAGANASPTLEPFQPLTTTVSYFLGNDPDRWRPSVPVWGGVRYADLYPGLDLELAGQGGELALQMVCRAADCEAALAGVQLQVVGADEIAIEGDALRLTTAAGEFRLPLLRVVDEMQLPLHLRVPGPRIVGQIVDCPVPVSMERHQSSSIWLFGGLEDLIYSTFLEGTFWEEGYAVDVDPAGNAAVTGFTQSVDFPTTSGVFDQSYNGNRDVFIAKLSPDGSELVYGTYLGGTDEDQALGLHVDGAGNVTVSGRTASADFPITDGAYDTSFNGGGGDAFVARLNQDGTQLLYGTFIGGSYEDRSYSVDSNDSGSATIAGVTYSPDFPTTADAFDEICGSDGNCNTSTDGFVTRLSLDGSTLLYSTYLGGSADDDGWALRVNASGTATVSGYTASPDFPTTLGAFDTTFNGGADAYVARLSLDGSQLIVATFLGGSSGDNSYALAVDDSGNAIVSGRTGSDNFPVTPGAFDTSRAAVDSFVASLSADGGELQFSTFLGGSSTDVSYGVVMDANGSIVIAGHTTSPDFPTTPAGFDTTFNGSNDAYVAVLTSDGTELAYGSFLGGIDADAGYALASNGQGGALITGATRSSDFPTTPGAFDTNLDGSPAFVSNLALVAMHVGGPTVGLIQTSYPFTATVSPITPTLPFTYTWQATEQQVVTHTAGLTDTNVYAWDLPGPKVITVTAASAVETYSATHQILLYAPPTADFAAEPTAGPAPLEVQVTNLATGDYDKCLWSFGDGSESPDCEDPAHEYALPGVYTVTLEVSGPGGKDILVREGYITVYAAAVFIPIALRPE